MPMSPVYPVSDKTPAHSDSMGFLFLLNIRDLGLPGAIDKVRVLELRNS